MASVVSQYALTSASATPNVPVAATPIAGDEVYVVLLTTRTTVPRSVTAISGLGGTWTALTTPANSRMMVYKSTNANAAGSVALTLSGASVNSHVGVFIVRGGPLPYATPTLSYSTAATSVSTPTGKVGANEVVLAVIGTSTATGLAVAGPSVVAPVGGWSTTYHAGMLTMAASAVPATSQVHHLTHGLEGGASGYAVAARLVLSTVETYENAMVALAPHSYWRLGETAPFTDYSHQGALNASSPILVVESVAAPSYGQVGALVTSQDEGAVLADGATNWVTTSALAGNTSRTMIVWIKTSVTPSVPTFVYGQWNVGSGGTFFALAVAENGKVRAMIDWITGRYFVESTTVVTDGQWHMVALTYEFISSALGTSRLYVDSIEEASNVSGTAPYQTVNRGAIGGRRFDTATITYFNGHIDEAALVPSTLTQSQLAHLYSFRRVPTVSGPRQWDGDSLEAAQLEGWRNGGAISPVEVLGYWTGSVVSPFGVT